jgi:excisionase family DNA binding protein
MKIRDEYPPSSVPDSSGTDSWGLEPLMDVGELASYLGLPVSTVYDWRVHGKGPVAYRFGKHLKFAVSDVRAWVAEQREAQNRR